MDPYTVHRLTNEVIFLHGLWHIGPPGAAAADPLPPQLSSQNPNPNLSVAHTANFKKSNRKKGKKKMSHAPASPAPADSGNKWPSIFTGGKDDKDSGWGKLGAVTERHEMSAESMERLAVKQMQKRVISICDEFFASSDEDDDGDDGGDDNEEIEDKEYEFFKRVFVENVRFREYYEKNYEDGEFCCLICCRKGMKTFKGCVGLVQHLSMISKKKRAHQALGRVVCEVLGWDYDRLPTIVLTGKHLLMSLVDAGESKLDADGHVNFKKKELDAGTSVGDSVDDDNCESVAKEVNSTHEAFTELQTNQSASIADIVYRENISSVVREGNKSLEITGEQQSNPSGSTVVIGDQSVMVKKDGSNVNQTSAETVVPKVDTTENIASDNKEFDVGYGTADIVEDDYPELYG